MTIDVEQVKMLYEMLDAQATADMQDGYMRGLYNGIELALSVVMRQEPVYMKDTGTLDAEAKARNPERYI